MARVDGRGGGGRGEMAGERARARVEGRGRMGIAARCAKVSRETNGSWGPASESRTAMVVHARAACIASFDETSLASDVPTSRRRDGRGASGGGSHPSRARAWKSEARGRAGGRDASEPRGDGAGAMASDAPSENARERCAMSVLASWRNADERRLPRRRPSTAIESQKNARLIGAIRRSFAI